MCCIFWKCAMINLLMIYVYNSLFSLKNFLAFGLTSLRLRYVWIPIIKSISYNHFLRN
jgi:hypothetical protein